MPENSRRFWLGVLAIYAAICVAWVGFAKLVAPTVIAAAHNGQNLLNLNWLLGEAVQPLKYYHEGWSVVAFAVPLAVMLHLVVVVTIRRIDTNNTIAPEPARQIRTINAILIAFSAVFLAVTVFSGERRDYTVYVPEWFDVLAGLDPWDFTRGFNENAYGPLFNVLAPVVLINVLANKILFAFLYLVYVIWLIKIVAPTRGLTALSWPLVFLLILNPYPWVEIAYLGYFDILVGLACVAAVYWQLNGKDWIAGASLGLGVLLKFMPIVILPFLAFSGRRVHFRLFISCVGVVVLGFALSILVWGTSTLRPIEFAATRPAEWSIYALLNSTHSPLRLFSDAPNTEWLEKPALSIALFVIFASCMRYRTEPALSATLASLVTLLFYRVGWFNYQMVFFVLVSFWTVWKWQELRSHPILVALLVSYLSFITVADLARLLGIVVDIFYSNMVIILIRCLLSGVLVIALIRFSASKPIAAIPAKAASERPAQFAAPQLLAFTNNAAGERAQGVASTST